MGVAFDLLVADGAKDDLRGDGRAHRDGRPDGGARREPALGDELKRSVAKAATYYATLGYASFAPGNADGGLTTIEEKSLGAYCEVRAIDDRRRGEARHRSAAERALPARRRPDGEVRFGFPNINDNAEIAELIACGSQVILFSTGRGSVVGSAIAPVIKVCANPDTYKRMEEDMDVDAGRILEGRATLPEVGREIYEAGAAHRQRRADQVGGARAPGVHPDVQELRAARAGLPAGLNEGMLFADRLLTRQLQ
jgi:altronate hydrolase